MNDDIICNDGLLVRFKANQRKFLERTNTNPKVVESVPKNTLTYECSNCGRVYKSHSWYLKHIPKCYKTENKQNIPKTFTARDKYILEHKELYPNTYDKVLRVYNDAIKTVKLREQKSAPTTLLEKTKKELAILENLKERAEKLLDTNTLPEKHPIVAKYINKLEYDVPKYRKYEKRSKTAISKELAVKLQKYKKLWSEEVK